MPFGGSNSSLERSSQEAVTRFTLRLHDVHVNLVRVPLLRQRGVFLYRGARVLLCLTSGVRGFCEVAAPSVVRLNECAFF